MVRLGEKLKMLKRKNIQKTILQEHQSCSVQKNARKNTKFSKNETIFKIGHLAKAIAHTKAIYSLCKMFS